MISGLKSIHLRESMRQQTRGEARGSERKVELGLWELEQWVRREGPTITASWGIAAEMLTSRLGEGQLTKTTPHRACVPITHRMAGCRCGVLFVPAAEDNAQMS